MRQALNIAVVDNEAEMRDWYARELPSMGHELVVNARDGQQFIERCHAARPNLLIVDVSMPRMGGLEAAAEIVRDNPIPVIAVSAGNEPDSIDQAAAQHVLAYLVKPIKRADLEAAIAIAMRQFEEFAALRRETNDLRHALDERKFIERAKGLIMRQIGLDEEAAFRRLQKMASEANRRLGEIARQIVATHEESARRKT